VVAVVSIWQPAHHPKIDGPSEHESLMVALLQAWRWRKASGTPVRDYLDRAQRADTDWRISLQRNAAQAWIRDKPRRMRERMRSSLRLVSGGRP
jgi:hypothetical protein